MSLNTNWVLQIDPIIHKCLKKIPRHDVERLLVAVKDLATDPFAGDIQKMGGEAGVWRKRVGSYRIRYELINEDKVVYVFRIERRTSSTY